MKSLGKRSKVIGHGSIILISLFLVTLVVGGPGCAGKSKKGALKEVAVKDLSVPDSKNTGGVEKNPEVVHISGAISKLQKRVAPVPIGKKALVAKKEPPSPLPGQSPSKEPLSLSNRRVGGVKQGGPPLSSEIASRSIVLNFDKADIVEVVAMVAEVLGIDYIVEPGVGGKVTIHTTGKIMAADLFSVLQQILSTNHLTLIKEGKYYKLTKMADARRKPIETYSGRDKDMLAVDDRMIIHLIPLEYLPADNLKAVLAPLLTKGGSFLKVPSGNIIGVIDTSNNIRRLLEIISVMDVSSFDQMAIKLFPIQFGKVTELEKELDEIFSATGIQQKEKFFKYTAIPRLNSMLVVAASRNFLNQVGNWIERLDMPETGEGSMGTFIYNVQNGEASNIESIIRALYSPSTQKDKPGKKADPKKKEVKGSLSGKPPKAPAVSQKNRTVRIGGSPRIEGELDIVSDAVTNSIIIRTNPLNYPTILETMEQLDRTPKQVMIEIMVAELTLDKSMQFGLEWAVKNANQGGSVDTGSNLGANLGNTNTFPGSSGGLSYFLHDTNSLLGLIEAKATESKLNVLSSPVILTSENKSASINVTSDVPIETTTRDSAGVTTSSFEYKSAGIKLAVTPRINSERFVSMDINQEVSTVGEKPAGAAVNAPPPFFTRQTQTNVVVRDKETLVIGGLIEESKTSSKRGIPWLSRIPIIGWLFGGWSDTNRKTELVIFITPHVIESVADAREVTESFQARVNFLQETVKNKKKL